MSKITVKVSCPHCKGVKVNKNGMDFAAIDAHPTRVRLPEGPLMLVDRILKIEGEPRSMTSGRCITDHAVRPDRWYLDAGRCPTSIAVEAGQADLFLSGYLGIDFITKGNSGDSTTAGMVCPASAWS